MWADDCWQWKNVDWPRVSCERLHRDVMDGARLFPRRVPANGALMAFQSEALNYGVELMAPAHNWEASTSVLLWYQYSEFDLSLKVDTISIQNHQAVSQNNRCLVPAFGHVLITLAQWFWSRFFVLVKSVELRDWDQLPDVADCLILAVFSLIWP